MEQSLQALSANQRLVEWTERISSCRSSGISVKQWCKENEIVEKTYYLLAASRFPGIDCPARAVFCQSTCRTPE